MFPDFRGEHNPSLGLRKRTVSPKTSRLSSGKDSGKSGGEA